MTKHVSCLSRTPKPATIGPGLTPIQQFFAFLSKGKFIPT
jgi:hypothetical protein